MREHLIEIPLANIIKAPWNYKEDDEEKMLSLIENIKEDGQLENVIVRELGEGEYKVVNGVETGTGLYEMVNGNHRHDGFSRCEYRSILCYNLGGVSLEKAKLIAVKTNETKFGTNTLLLARVVGDILGKYDFDYVEKQMPYSAAELSGFGDLLNMNWEAFAGEITLEQITDDQKITYYVVSPKGYERIKRIAEEEDTKPTTTVAVRTQITITLDHGIFAVFLEKFKMSRDNRYSTEALIEYLKSE